MYEGNCNFIDFAIGDIFAYKLHGLVLHIGRNYTIQWLCLEAEGHWTTC